MKLAVVMPVYNEVRWLRSSLERLIATPPSRQGAGDDPSAPRVERVIILVDDGSTDGTRPLIATLIEEARVREAMSTGEASLTQVRAVLHDVNEGKGAALRTGFREALDLGADIVIVQDADLEYDPRDHDAVLRPILDGRAEVVIGSRFIGATHRVLYYWHSVANRAITELCCMAANLNLTDVECCLKAFKADVLRQIAIQESRFGVEIELVIKAARARVRETSATAGNGPTMPAAESQGKKVRVYEVAVSYAGRTYEEGKKIGWRDGVEAIVCIAKYGLYLA
jgi:glycosyltransferase involved in cell wall biosynthesis